MIVSANPMHASLARAARAGRSNLKHSAARGALGDVRRAGRADAMLAVREEGRCGIGGGQAEAARRAEDSALTTGTVFDPELPFASSLTHCVLPVPAEASTISSAEGARLWRENWEAGVRPALPPQR